MREEFMKQMEWDDINDNLYKNLIQQYIKKNNIFYELLIQFLSIMVIKYLI